MNVSEMRKVIMEDYSSDKWKQRVKMMPDSQVMAIYFRKCRDGGLKSKEEQGREEAASRQLSMFDKHF